LPRRLKIHVVKHDQHIRPINLKKVQALPDTPSAGIHKCLRSQQNDFLTADRMIRNKAIESRPTGRKKVPICERVDDVEPDIVPSQVVSRTRIPKPHNQLHDGSFLLVVFIRLSADDFRLNSGRHVILDKININILNHVDSQNYGVTGHFRCGSLRQSQVSDSDRVVNPQRAKTNREVRWHIEWGALDCQRMQLHIQNTFVDLTSSIDRDIHFNSRRWVDPLQVDVQDAREECVPLNFSDHGHLDVSIEVDVNHVCPSEKYRHGVVRTQ